MTEPAAPYGSPTVRHDRVWVFNEASLEQALSHYAAEIPNGEEQVKIIRQFLKSDVAIEAGLVRRALLER